MNVRLALLFAFFVTGCTDGGSLLFVDVRTDLVPGGEFYGVLTRLEPMGGGTPRTQMFVATQGAHFLNGVRSADFDGVPAGRYRLTVELRDARGAVVGTRSTELTLDANYAVTMVIARSCGAVVCGDGQTCASGRCVDLRCTPETPDACGSAACAAPSDCPAPAAACAEASCVLGECFAVEREDAMCAEGSFCQPETDCVEYPSLPDAGIRDAGPPDAAVPLDGGPPTELPVQTRPIRGAHFGHVSITTSAPPFAPSTGRPKFHWTFSPGAESFHLQVSRAPDFSSLDLDIHDITDDYWVAEPASSEVLGDSGKYFWRVTACNAAGCAPFGEPSYFWLGRVREEPDGEFDGVGAVIVGAPGSGQTGAGGASIRRGEVLSFVYTTTTSTFLPPRIGTADAPGDDETELGTSIVAANFTGSPSRHHLAAGGPLIAGERGTVRIFAGDDPSMFLDLNGATSVSRYGNDLGAADFDGDGHDDLVVAEPGDGSVPGQVYVYWGNGAGLSASRKLGLMTPVGAGDGFGHALAAIGDVNGDGYSDFAVGAPFTGRAIEGPAGRVHVYYGGPDVMMAGVLAASRTEVDSPLPETDEEFGFAIAGVGDVNWDGYDDALVGAPGHSSTRGAGSAYLFFGGDRGLGSGPFGGVIRIPHPDDPGPIDARFGEVLSGGGDLDGNGFPDFVIAAPADGNGRVFVYPVVESDPFTVPDSFELLRGVTDPSMRYGACLALTVDRSGDGHADVVVGAPFGLNRGPGGGMRETGFVDIWFGAPDADPTLEQTIWGTGLDPAFVARFGETCL